MHINEAKKIMDSGQKFQLRCWTKSGTIMEIKEAVCISSWVRKGTRRIKLFPSYQIREVRDVTIFELNHEEVYI